MYISKTPLRVSFFGGGTDYPSYFKNKPSAVFGGTINKYVYTTALPLAPFAEQKFRISYRVVEDVNYLEYISHPVIREYLRLCKFDKPYSFATMSDLPGSTGLGSSSSFTVGFINLISVIEQNYLPSRESLALAAINLEQVVLRENVGVQDQTHAALGGLARYDFAWQDNQTSISRDRVVLPYDRMQMLNKSMVLVYTSIQRHASKVLAAQEDRTVKGDNNSYLSSMYDMVGEGVTLLESDGDDIDILKQFGKLLNEGWELKKGLSSQISNPVIENIYQTGRDLGAYGGKLLGAGGGGFVLFLIDPDKIVDLEKEFGKNNVIPVEFVNDGSQVQAV
jgi:D-glycero-alpha-D-manno-heptose-7-phosphate kinase